MKFAINDANVPPGKMLYGFHVTALAAGGVLNVGFYPALFDSKEERNAEASKVFQERQGPAYRDALRLDRASRAGCAANQLAIAACAKRAPARAQP
jgi:hypothetical protein